MSSWTLFIYMEALLRWAWEVLSTELVDADAAAAHPRAVWVLTGSRPNIR
jgi:hypothetical protein